MLKALAEQMPSFQTKIEQHRLYTTNFANHPRVILTSVLSLLSCNEMYQDITPIFFLHLLFYQHANKLRQIPSHSQWLTEGKNILPTLHLLHFRHGGPLCCSIPQDCLRQLQLHLYQSLFLFKVDRKKLYKFPQETDRNVNHLF